MFETLFCPLWNCLRPLFRVKDPLEIASVSEWVSYQMFETVASTSVNGIKGISKGGIKSKKSIKSIEYQKY